MVRDNKYAKVQKISHAPAVSFEYSFCNVLGLNDPLQKISQWTVALCADVHRTGLCLTLWHVFLLFRCWMWACWRESRWLWRIQVVKNPSSLPTSRSWWGALCSAAGATRSPSAFVATNGTIQASSCCITKVSQQHVSFGGALFTQTSQLRLVHNGLKI